MTVTVYSQPACPQCRATYRALERRGVDFTVIDLSQDAPALDLVRTMGYSQAPVVVAGDEHWSGFRAEKIAALAEQVAEPARLVA
ncbi:MAG: glutaredoxin-like protein NrdH [Bifidobacteriaceae bacterium]|jgi:glutaredoxin-like protein NrdH|nr:glutaredoxin-like protein NrdH [Bifidobacteriaceae bacterium]